MSKAAAGKAIDSMVTNIIKSVKKETKVSLAGFGIFGLSKRRARIGQAIKIPAHKAPKFFPGRGFKDAVR